MALSFLNVFDATSWTNKTEKYCKKQWVEGLKKL